eukprot:COSAG02_NODE_1584_length_11821_cov_11.601604_10_plen_82_part_00
MVDATVRSLDEAYKCVIDGERLLVKWNKRDPPQVCHPYIIQDQSNGVDDMDSAFGDHAQDPDQSNETESLCTVRTVPALME